MYTTVLILGALGATFCAVSTRRYEATGTVQIQKDSSDGLGLDSLMSDAGGASDALEANIIIQTQANILQSDTLALKTIENLHMEQTQDFLPRFPLLGRLTSLFTPSGTPDPVGASLEDSPERRRRALKIFSKNLTVTPVSGTRIIEINYLNPDPKLSAAVVNELTQGLIDYTFQTRFNATNQASTWLTGQLSELRKQSEDLQAKVVSLERQSGVYSLGTVDASGREQAYSGVLDKLQQETVALSEAQQNRILKGAIAKAAESGDAELLSGLSGNSMVGGMSMNNSLALIQTLRQQESTQQALLHEAEAKYGEAYPKLAEMRANLESVRRSIQGEVTRLKDRAQSDFEIAQQGEAKTQAEYDGAKAQADKLNDKAIEYMIVRQEAEESRELYEDLLKRLKEAGVLEGLKSSNITIIDPGRVPSKPKKPNIPLYMLASLGGGAILGFLLALIVDSMDSKISGISEAETLTSRTLFGATPLIVTDTSPPSVEGVPATEALQDPHSTFTESLRTIRTAILLTGGSDSSRVILLTSSIAGEGKTTISLNLAVVLAQSNRKILLVDVDLRKAGLSRRLHIAKTAGLSELLAGQITVPELTKIPGVPNLDFLQAGTAPPYPSELLDSQIGSLIELWRKQYDFVLLDGPPLLPVTDGQIIHPLVDITLLLSRTGLTERGQLLRSYRILTEPNKHFVGVIVNGLRPEDESYYGYYGYRQYSYKYSEDPNATTK